MKLLLHITPFSLFIAAFHLRIVNAQAYYNMEFYANTECRTEAGRGTACANYNYGDCCDAGTDLEGDALGPWQSSTSYGNRGSDVDYTYTVYLGDSTYACASELGSTGSLPDCAVYNNIQGGIATPGSPSRRSLDAEHADEHAIRSRDSAENPARNRGPYRCWIWRFPQDDGTFWIYRIVLGTPEATEYKNQETDEAKKAYMLANWHMIVVLDHEQKRVLREIYRY